MISRLLVANRGEIACRIFRTCRRMGIRTVAVYSDADAQARHVCEADAAERIGPAPARASYLDAQAIVAAALRHGAQAVHPGYGFLSEKLELVDACGAAGLLFVGPHRDAIARMGSKIESKRIARAAGVACVPGYDGDDQDDARLLAEAQAIGFPLLVKASAGGGGKGMRRVDRAQDFPAQLALARTEARAAFADDRVLLERYVQRPRHLEVQLLGDRHGGLVHLFERECSIQRHYQKVIEEAPANHLPQTVRERLYAAALSLGRAIGYDSAGTVEFVLDADAGHEPYFLEMNTRLQVEHPVTELTTGIDLVEQQIRSACGERLPWPQDAITRSGWAIEARVNAEVPAEDYRPSFGAIAGYEEPAQAGVRIDSGIDGASEVPPHYDSMLAKVVAHGATREVARLRLRQALTAFRIEGVQTNQPLLADVLAAPAFAEVLTTRFLADAWPGGWRPQGAAAAEAAGIAAAGWCLGSLPAGAPDRPLERLAGFRLTAPAGRAGRVCVWVAEAGAAARTQVDVDIRRPDAVLWHAGGRQGMVALQGREGDALRLSADGVAWRARVHGAGVGLWCAGDGREWLVEPVVRAGRRTAGGVGAGDVVVASLPGVVSELRVGPGQAVAAGEPVAVLEAMKLFHTLVAPRDGVVAGVPCRVGDTVARGAVVVELVGQAPAGEAA
ncbi:MAG: biotin carboxylase N-terminal domain-containing protein [Burkholderiales bacterium]